MIYKSDDPVRDAETHIQRLDEQASKYPSCYFCGCNVADMDAWETDDGVVCENCWRDYFNLEFTKL